LKLGKLLSPACRRAAVEEVQRALPEVSERRACLVLGQPRAVQRSTARVRDDEAPLTGRIVELAPVYGRYGSPRITGMLRNEGWNVNHKRVERIWRQAGLKVPNDRATSAIGVPFARASSACLILATTSSGRCRFLFVERFIGDSSRPLGP
jgi:transposase InsO family protein